MRHIEVDEGFRVRFPNRSEDFDDGVEVGVVSAFMAIGGGDISRSVSTANLEQLRAVAQKLGYHLIESGRQADRAEVVLKAGRPRTKLQLVHSGLGPLPPNVTAQRALPVLTLAKAVGAPERADRIQTG